MLQSFEKLNIDGKDKMENGMMRSESQPQPPCQEARKIVQNSRGHRQHHNKKGEQAGKSPTRVGCFNRPKLPQDVLAQAAVRDDLGKWELSRY